MRQVRPVKSTLVALWVAAAFVFVISGFSDASGTMGYQAPAAAAAGEYAGSESCKECHEEEATNFAGTSHAMVVHSRFQNNEMTRGCESCHGPGQDHVTAEKKRKEALEMGLEVPDYDSSLIVSFSNRTSKEISDNCLTCHAGMGEERGNYRRGEHWRNDVGCTDCHDAHGTPLPPDRVGSQTFTRSASEHKIDQASRAMLKQSDPQICISCHSEMQAQFTMPFRHRVLEGHMNCSDCHNPHGGFELRQARLATGNDMACVKCHTDKQGPFSFEHAPLKTEGCASCHTPHGSVNPRLLKRADVFQLCIECHTDAHELGGAPGTPSFHNLAQERYRNCTTCHVQIHGSMSHPFFFR